MGEIVDQIIEDMYDSWDRTFNECDDWSPVTRAKQRKRTFQSTTAYEWKDADKQIWNMWEMETIHIQRCLRLLQEYNILHDKQAQFEEVLAARKADIRDLTKRREAMAKKLFQKPTGSVAKTSMFDDEIPF